MFVAILIVVCVGCVVQCTGFTNVNGYYSWGDENRTKLYCPDYCVNNGHPDRCCSCKARRCWDIIPDECPMSSLHIEYMDIYGNGQIVSSNNATYATLKHINGRLTTVPDNICSFSKSLVILDLRGNRLTNVSSLRCLHKLDTLRLDNNRITEMDNTTFSKMSDLRILSVKNNLLKSLSPNVIHLDYGNIFSVDFSENKQIEAVDLTNVFRPGHFCMLNFSDSSVEHLTNELGFTITDTEHGPGDIFLEHTEIGSFMNFSEVGVTDYSELGKYISGTISIDESSVTCDCSIYPFIANFGDGLDRFWPNIDGLNFYCQSPDSMKGIDLIQAYKTGMLDDLTCDISTNPDCPSYYCQCIEQPSRDKILVNCTAKNFTSMPRKMPVGSWNLQNIDLILAKNKIQNIENRDYLHRVVNLDLRENLIDNFDKEAAKNLHATLNIEDQKLSTLPVGISDKNPNLYTFGDNPVMCDCSNLWIGDWIRFHDGHGRLNCSADGIVVAAEAVDEYSLDCRQYDIFHIWPIIGPLVGVLTALIMSISLSFIFRYDIMLLRRRFHRNRSSVSPSTGLYDVFISFYTDTPEVFQTVSRYLRPELQKLGYSIFVPWFDIISGDRDQEMMKAVDISRNFVVVLCNNYADNFDTLCEFETIWNSFLRNKSKFIVIINFDNLDTGSVSDDRLKALRRSKYCLDFANRGSKLITRLVKMIGKPAEISQVPESVDEEFQFDTDDEKNENTDNDSLKESLENDDNSNENERSKNVFNRLARPKSGICNCKYRVCYLHNDAFKDKVAN